MSLQPNASLNPLISFLKIFSLHEVCMFWKACLCLSAAFLHFRSFAAHPFAQS